MAAPWERNWGTSQGGSPRQGVIVRDPYRSRDEARKDEDQSFEAERIRIAREAEDRLRATQGSVVRKSDADARKSEIEADRAAAEAAKAPKPEAARIQNALKTSALLEALNSARSQIGQGWATGNMAGTKGFQGIPFVGQNSTNLDATLSGIKGSILTDTLAQMKAQSASGASGMGSLTEKEGERLAASIGALQQAQDDKSLLQNLAKVEKHYRNMLALSYGEDPRKPEIATKYGIVSDEDREKAPGASKGGSVTSEGKMENDPALAGVNATASRMVKQGRSPEEIRDFLNAVRPGLGDASGVTIEDIVKFHRQNPDSEPQFNAERNWQQAGGFSQTMGAAGMNPVGSGVIGAADMVTGGTLDNMTGNPDLTRAVMTGVQKENPGSYMAGQLAGGALAGMGGEALLARGGLTGLTGSRTADATVGALYGAGSADEPDDSRIAGLLLGGASGLGGGMLGRTAARAGGRAISGVQDAARQALNQAGVRMTPGQILGGGIKRTEDRLSGLPIVGDQIGARRMEGLQDFNSAAMREAVAPIGAPGQTQIGQAGVNTNQQAISGAYDSALSGRQFQADPQFQSDIAAALAYGQQIPQLGDQFGAVMDNRVGSLFGPNGEINGNGFQDAIQGIRKASSATANEVMSNEFDQGVGMVEDGLRGLVNRQAPDVIPAYDAANAAYRNQSVIDDAVSKALNQGGTFTPAQLGQASRANTIKYGGKRAAARGDMPFNDLQQAAQEVLPNQIPDSGTAGRLILPGVVGGLAGGGSYAAADGDTSEKAGYGAGGAVVAALIAAAPYSATARTGLQRLLLAERPVALQQAGNALIDTSGIAGLLAAPATVIQATDR